jgi:quaternary ammonium compound-resistance protein SugE
MARSRRAMRAEGKSAAVPFFPNRQVFAVLLSHPCRANIARRGRTQHEDMTDVCVFPRDSSAVRAPFPQSRATPLGDYPARAGDAVSPWLALLAAGLLEIAWAFGLKYSDGLTRFWPTAATAIAILASFALMALALRSLPFGTAYAVWTGIGAAGSIIVGMVIFSEPTDPVRLICLTLIVAGMVGLKLNSPV